MEVKGCDSDNLSEEVEKKICLPRLWLCPRQSATTTSSARAIPTRLARASDSSVAAFDRGRNFC